jgi:uncharacterized protein
MSKTPPERIDPVTASDKGRSFDGHFPLARMERLSDMLLEHSGDVSFTLRFGREGLFYTVRGSVAAELTLECQCCLSAMKLPVDEQFALGVLSALEQESELPESLEPLIVGDEGVISVVQLIEDELLLAVPHVPQHSACAVRDGPGPPEREAKSLLPGAFADLPSLIHSNQTKNKTVG